MNLPFVMISAFLKTEHTVEAMRLGARDVANGWIDIDRLVAMVVSALEKTSSTRPTDGEADAISPDVRGSSSGSRPLRSVDSEWLARTKAFQDGARPGQDQRHQPDLLQDALSYARTQTERRARSGAYLVGLETDGWKRRGVEEQLDVEEQTEKEILDRAGIGLEPSDKHLTVQDVLDAQPFIPQDSPVLRSRRSLLTAETGL